MPKPPDLDAEIDALFKLPLSEFTSARNALASRLKKEGRALDAERVKATTKPTAPAWAVNQLHWQSPRDMDRLLTAGERVRNAQTGGEGDLRELLDERKKVVAELMVRAKASLSEAGGASPDAMQRVKTTLESLAGWGHSPNAPQLGRLTADLEPLGFDALAALMSGKKIEPAKVLQFRTERDRAANAKKAAEEAAAAQAQAREAVKAAESTLREARRDAERADATLAKANARAEELEARYNAAKEEARVASNDARKAAQAVTNAERALERARASLVER